MGFHPLHSIDLFDRGFPLWITMQKPSSMVSASKLALMSPDIDLLPVALDVIHQTSGANSVPAHAVRIARMSTQSLARYAYPAYLEFRHAMQRESGPFTDTGLQTLWVPVYCACQAEHYKGGGSTRWSVSRMRGGPLVIGNAVRPKKEDAVREASRFIEAFRNSAAASPSAELSLLLDPQAPELHWFTRHPLSSDQTAVALESVWRTVKSDYPNEVALAELVA